MANIVTGPSGQNVFGGMTSSCSVVTPISKIIFIINHNHFNSKLHKNNTMKKLFYLSVICLLFIQSAFAFERNPIADRNNLPAFEIARPCTVIITLSGGLHKRKSGCTGLALGCLDISVKFNAAPVGGGKTDVGLEMRSASQLVLSAYYPEKITDKDFEVEEDTPVGTSICEQLGYSSITIKKGFYKYSRDKSNILTVDLTCVSKK
jgi:hypothetical protein